MENLSIEQTDDRPYVNFIHENGTMEINGKSLPEDVSTFYLPILEWLNKYSLNPNNTTEFTFKFTYFNTASSKMILDILLVLESMKGDNRQVIVNWYYPYYDEDMKDAGKEYSEMVDLQFNHIGYTP
jgi:hypothetical protein